MTLVFSCARLQKNLGFSIGNEFIEYFLTASKSTKILDCFCDDRRHHILMAFGMTLGIYLCFSLLIDCGT